MIAIPHILCPVDFSDTSRRALQHASALAGWYDSRLTALFVDTTQPIENAVDSGDLAIAPAAVMEATRPPCTVPDLRTFVTRAPCGAEVDAVVEEATDVDAAILECARRLPADLIVMGTHGRTGVGRLLLGSVC